MTSPPQLTKEEQDILDFLILPSEFELSQMVAVEALDRIVASHSSAQSEDRGWSQGFQDGQTSALVDLNLFEMEIREKVLDELQRWGSGYYGYEINVATLQIKIAELRNQEQP
jgi:hypothetical protein